MKKIIQQFVTTKKQKWQWNKKQGENKKIKPQLLQNIHQQLFARMHNLDYLQWLQRNAKLHTFGMVLLAVLLSTSVYAMSSEWQYVSLKQAEQMELLPSNQTIQNNLPGVSVQNGSVTNKNQQNQDVQDQEMQGNDWQAENQPAFQDAVYDIAADTAMEQAEQPQNGKDTTQIQQNAEPVYSNPLDLQGYVSPCNGTLQYGYGLGYDAIHEDYRFHTEVCYHAGDGTVLACVSGVVTQVQMTEQWQVTIQCEEGQIQYAGLTDCIVQPGNAVMAGQKIGTAAAKVYLQAVK